MGPGGMGLQQGAVGPHHGGLGLPQPPPKRSQHRKLPPQARHPHAPHGAPSDFVKHEAVGGLPPAMPVLVPTGEAPAATPSGRNGAERKEWTVDEDNIIRESVRA